MIANRSIITVGTSHRAVVQRNRFNSSLMQFLHHIADEIFGILLQFSQLAQGNNRRAFGKFNDSFLSVFFHHFFFCQLLHRNKNTADFLVHCLEYVLVIQKQSAHAIAFFELRVDISLLRFPSQRGLRRLGRHIQDSGRHASLIFSLRRIPKRKQIQKHLYVQSVYHIAQLKFFVAGFVVDDAHILYTVLLIGVYPVDSALYHNLGSVRRYHFSCLYLPAPSDLQFKISRNKAALPNFFSQMGNNLKQCIADAMIQI